MALGPSDLDEAVALSESGRHDEAVREIRDLMEAQPGELSTLERVAGFIGRSTPGLRQAWFECNLGSVSADIAEGRLSALTLLNSIHGPLQGRVELLAVSLRSEEGGVGDLPLLVDISRLAGARMPTLEALARRRLLESGSRALLEFALTRELIREAEAAVSLTPKSVAPVPGRPSPLPLWRRRSAVPAVHDSYAPLSPGERVAVSDNHVAMLDPAGSMVSIQVLDVDGKVLHRAVVEVPQGLTFSQGRLALANDRVAALLEWRRKGSFLPERSDLVIVDEGGTLRHEGVLGRGELSVAAPLIDAERVILASADIHNLGLTGGSIWRRLSSYTVPSGERQWSRVIGESPTQLLQTQEVPRMTLSGGGLDVLWGGSSCLIQASSGCLIESGTSLEREAPLRLGSDGGLMPAGQGTLQWGRSGVSFMHSGKRMILTDEPCLSPPAVGSKVVALLTSGGLSIHRWVEASESDLKKALGTEPGDASRWAALALMEGTMPSWPTGAEAWHNETFAQFLVPLLLETLKSGTAVVLPKEATQEGSHPMFKVLQAWIRGETQVEGALELPGGYTLTSRGFRRALSSSPRPVTEPDDPSLKRVRQFDTSVWPERSAGQGLLVGSDRVLRLADGRVMMLPAKPLAVGEGCVLIQQEGHLVCLDLRPDGSASSRWSCPDPTTPVSSHIKLWNVSQGETLLFPDLVVVRRGAILRVLDSKSGDLLWSRRVRTPATRVEGMAVWVGPDGYDLYCGRRLNAAPPTPVLPSVVPEVQVGSRRFRAEGTEGRIVEVAENGSLVATFPLGVQGRVRALKAKGDDVMAVVEGEDGRGKLLHLGLHSGQVTDLTPEGRDFDDLSSGRRFIAARARRGENVVFVYE